MRITNTTAKIAIRIFELDRLILFCAKRISPSFITILTRPSLSIYAEVHLFKALSPFYTGNCNYLLQNLYFFIWDKLKDISYSLVHNIFWALIIKCQLDHWTHDKYRLLTYNVETVYPYRIISSYYILICYLLSHLPIASPILMAPLRYF